MKIIPGNRITLYKNGASLFPAMIAAIDAATTDVRVETYIFENDASGQPIADALSRAARRGVAVRLLVDGFGSLRAPESFFEAMVDAGVKLLIYRPLRGKWIPTRHRVRRLHRKIVVIDGTLGFIGGINFIDDFIENLSDTAPRFDYAVGFQGPVLADVYVSVHRLWRTTKWFTRPRIDRDNAMPEVSSAAVGDASLAFVSRDNVRHRRNIERAYRAAINAAREEVLIAVPYFLPGRRLRQTLIAAARRGVRVEILLQGAADHPVMQLATEAMYAQLFEAGVVIYEYQAAMLHAKVAVIDGRWATVGSSNLDPFSLLLNREANIVALDVGFAQVLRSSLKDEIDRNARKLDARAWQQRSWLHRVASWLALAVTRVSAMLVGAVDE